jgi:Ni/Co efflux regulator RcnB
MKRLIISLAVAAAVAGPFASKPAHAEPRWERSERSERWERREERSERGNHGRVDRWERREWNGDGRRGHAERRWREERSGRSAERPAPAYRPGYALRRGGRLPDAYRGRVVEDYPRYRLRPPPRGYDWYHVQDNYMLAGPNGVIFDIIPE